MKKIGIGSSGRVNLSEDIMQAVANDKNHVFAGSGGDNRHCSNNTDCSGTLNRHSCLNSANCDGARNATNCTVDPFHSIE